MGFKKSFQSRSTPVRGRFNVAFDDNESNFYQPSNDEYRVRVRNHLMSQLTIGNELMEKWGNSNNLALTKLASRKLSLQEEYEETNLVLVNVKNLQKRDFYAENRAKLDLENFLPDLVIQWQDNANHKSYKEILSELAQQVIFFNRKNIAFIF